MEVEVKTLCGDQFSASFASNSRIHEVKVAVAKAFGIIPREQKLFSGSSPVEDTKTLADFGTVQSLALQLFRRTPEEGLWLETISLEPEKYSTLPVSLRENYEIAEIAIRKRKGMLKFASRELQADRNLVLLACRTDPSNFEFAAEELRSDEEVVLAAVSQKGDVIKFASGAMQANAKVVKVAVSNCQGLALEFAAEQLRGDRDLVLQALSAPADSEAMGRASRNGLASSALACVPAELRADRQLVMAAVRQNGRALEFAATELQMDSEVARLAVQQDGSALEFAPEALRADRELVLEAVSSECSALQFAAEHLRADPEVVLTATAGSGEMIEYASEELRSDREFILKVVSSGNGGFALDGEALPAHWMQDREIVMAAVSTAPWALRFDCWADAREDREVILAAVRADPSIVKPFGCLDMWRQDPEIVELAKLCLGGSAH